MAVAAQLVPLPVSLWARLSPHAIEVDRALRLDAATQLPTAHALSLDPNATAWALALGAGYVSLFWCARAIFADGTTPGGWVGDTYYVNLNGTTTLPIPAASLGATTGSLTDLGTPGGTNMVSIY